MPELGQKRTVLQVLASLRGLDDLKQLFWTELNYERENTPLSDRGWPDVARAALAQAPLLLACGGAGGRFQVEAHPRTPSWVQSPPRRRASKCLEVPKPLVARCSVAPKHCRLPPPQRSYLRFVGGVGLRRRQSRGAVWATAPRIDNDAQIIPRRL